VKLLWILNSSGHKICTEWAIQAFRREFMNTLRPAVLTYRPRKRRNKPGIAYTLLLLVLVLMIIMTSAMAMYGQVELRLCAFLSSAFLYAVPSYPWWKSRSVPHWTDVTGLDLYSVRTSRQKSYISYIWKNSVFDIVQEMPWRWREWNFSETELTGTQFTERTGICMSTAVRISNVFTMYFATTCSML